MNFKSILATLILTSMLATGLIAYVSGLATSYEKSVDLSSMNRTMDALNKTNLKIGEINSTINQIKFSSDIGTLVWSSVEMVKLGVQSIQLIFGSVNVISNILSDSVLVLSGNNILIPPWFFSGVIALITLSLLVLMIEAFLRWKLE